MKDFSGFNLPTSLSHALTKLGFTIPTPIQIKAMPFALEGRDVLGSAQTGTGKTAAFGIPLVVKLINEPKSAAIILTPTRELATQVLKQLQELLGHSTNIRCALLIGGDSMGKQLSQLKARPRIFVGTPGRINDHLMRKSLNLSATNFLVLDEMDRMLDMGFGVQLEKIIKHMPTDRQTLMFSATMPTNIMKTAEKYLRNPERVAVGSTILAAPKIKQELIHTPETEKYSKLVALLDERKGSILVFVKTKHGADRLSQKLVKHGHNAEAIHGDLRQRQRDRVIQSFRDKKHRIMVATDVAARGLDIPHIEHVINYDLPQAPEDYIHRIGRTARAGAEGSAVCLITPADGMKWRAIHRLMHPGEAPPPRGPSSSARPAANTGRRFNKFGGKKSSFAGKPNADGVRTERGKKRRDDNRKSGGAGKLNAEGARTDRGESRNDNRKSGFSGKPSADGERVEYKHKRPFRHNRAGKTA